MRNINNISYWLVASLLLLGIYSCKENEMIIPDTDIDLTINRTEDLAFGDSFDLLKSTYPAFAELFYSQIVPLRQDDPQVTNEEWQSFKNDPFIQELKTTSDSVFTDLIEVEKTLKYGLNNAIELGLIDQIPRIYTFVSGLSYQCFLFDDEDGEGVGVGLDMFLGDAFPYEQLAPQNPSFSQYVSRTFNKKHLAKKVLETIVADRLGDLKGNTMLDHMIHNGKTLYVLDQLLPALPDSIIHEYTGDQLEWCESNQQPIWSHFIRDDLFYDTDLRKFNKLVNPSPSSPGMPDEAPGRTANFIGAKIVTAFMSKNPDLSLNDLLAFKDSQGMLDKSKYKPR
jgi:hypothetical protein